MWDAFWLLSNGRTRAFNGSNPIALSEILAFLDFKGIRDSDTQEEYIELIRRMDIVWLRHETDRIQEELERNGRGRESRSGD